MSFIMPPYTAVIGSSCLISLSACAINQLTEIKLNKANKAKENWPKLQAFRDTLDKRVKIHKDLSVWVFLAISSFSCALVNFSVLAYFAPFTFKIIETINL